MDYKKYFKSNQIKISNKQFIAVKLGGLITAARLYSRMSQAELAKKIGTQQPSLARAEKGEVAPSVEFLFKIAKAINTDFIFPKYGFMDDRESTTNTFASLSDSPIENLYRPKSISQNGISSQSQKVWRSNNTYPTIIPA